MQIPFSSTVPCCDEYFKEEDLTIDILFSFWSLELVVEIFSEPSGAYANLKEISE